MKKTKKNAWKHRFVCLARHDETRIPTTDTEKDDLLETGLGENSLSLLTDIPNSRQMEPLTAVAYSSPSVLKERVGSTRIYFVPLQRELDMTIVIGLPEGVSVYIGFSCSMYLKNVLHGYLQSRVLT